jgi:hypothetical protein
VLYEATSALDASVHAHIFDLQTEELFRAPGDPYTAALVEASRLGSDSLREPAEAPTAGSGVADVSVPSPLPSG